MGPYYEIGLQEPGSVLYIFRRQIYSKKSSDPHFASTGKSCKGLNRALERIERGLENGDRFCADATTLSSDDYCKLVEYIQFIEKRKEHFSKVRSFG